MNTTKGTSALQGGEDVSWDARWMALCDLVATWSKDRSRKCGAVIVGERQVLLAIGWNGFPRGVDDDVEERHGRPTKYRFTEHAERNAILNAAAEGIRLRGSTLYVTGPPCCDCARAIIQAGIVEVVMRDWRSMDHDEATFGFGAADQMFAETAVMVRGAVV